LTQYFTKNDISTLTGPDDHDHQDRYSERTSAMCGRFILLTDLTKIAESFDIAEIDCGIHPGGDVSPGQRVISIIHDGSRRLVEFKWGFVPHWAKDPAIGSKMINARSETLAEKPAFRDAFGKQRCLIVCDGFYEWKKEGKRKIPVRFILKLGEPFVLAGLYASWKTPDGPVLKTCTIITTDANELILPVHDRMPVILRKKDLAEWLEPTVKNPARFLPMLKPYPANEMEASAADSSDFESKIEKLF